jgi:hypothetical protein
MEQSGTYNRISIYPLDQTEDKRKKLMDALQEIGISYSYEAY